ncbi:MAG: hypothetical protein KDC38_03415 [Planctomycetes bacterium]|nr:hypothetical protein [Planctomycetota bacterium]
MGVDVHCEHCGSRFEAAPSLRGGFANCPSCGRATPIPGGPEPILWLSISFGVLLGGGATWLAAASLGPTAGLVTGCCAVAGLIIFLLSA